jgi:hypothetical protein
MELKTIVEYASRAETTVGAPQETYMGSAPAHDLLK